MRGDRTGSNARSEKKSQEAERGGRNRGQHLTSTANEKTSALPMKNMASRSAEASEYVWATTVKGGKSVYLRNLFGPEN